MIVKHNGVIMELLKFAGKPKPTNIQLSVEIYMHNQSLGMITGDNWEPHKSFEHWRMFILSKGGSKREDTLPGNIFWR